MWHTREGYARVTEGDRGCSLGMTPYLNGFFAEEELPVDESPTPLTESSVQAEPGELLVGKYRLEKLIGAGGFSRVYLAEHVEMQRKVAVKLLDLEGAVAEAGGTTAADLQQRFGREARMSSQLNHPNTITVYDFGVDPRGRWYIVMEYVEGIDLHQALRAEGKMEPTRAARIARDVMRSLSEAHHLGVLHRDLKPGNIMLSTDYEGRERATVLDFGVSTVHSVGGGELSERFEPMQATMLGTFVGTPQYAAPEQFLGDQLSPAADVYATGLVLWEMLAGHPAIEGEEFGSCLRAHLDKTPWELPAAVPAGLDDILRGALARDPAKRYLSAKEMEKDLDLWLRGEQSAFQPSPATEERWEPKFDYRSVERDLADEISELHDPVVIDPNVDDGAVPEFLRPPMPASSTRTQTTGASQPAPKQNRRTEEPLELDFERAPRRPRDRIVRPSPGVAGRRSLRDIPWPSIAAVVGVLVVGWIAYSVLFDEPDPDRIELMPGESAYRDLEEPEPAAGPEPTPRFSVSGVLRALEAGGWSVRRTGETNVLANVHQQGYRLSRDQTELEIELVTTKSSAIAQKMLEGTREPIRGVVLDNKLVRVFPPGGKEHPDSDEIVSLLRRYRSLVLESGEEVR